MSVEIGTKWRDELSGSFLSCHAEHIEFIDGSNDFNILTLQIFPESWVRVKRNLLSGVRGLVAPLATTSGQVQFQSGGKEDS